MERKRVGDELGINLLTNTTQCQRVFRFCIADFELLVTAAFVVALIEQLEFAALLQHADLHAVLHLQRQLDALTDHLQIKSKLKPNPEDSTEWIALLFGDQVILLQKSDGGGEAFIAKTREELVNGVVDLLAVFRNGRLRTDHFLMDRGKQLDGVTHLVLALLHARVLHTDDVNHPRVDRIVILGL